MKHLLIAAALAGGISLAGCTGVNFQQDVTTLEQLVQQDAVAICSFIPTVETLDQIAAVYIPGAAGIVQDANQIATAICQSVSASVTPSGKLRATPVTIVVNGKTVVVHGGYVSK